MLFRSGIQQSGLFIDLWLVKSRMISFGMTKVQADVLWGVLFKYTTLINVPIAIISSLAITILPSISSLMALRDKKAVRNKINYAFRLCFLVAVPCAVGLAVLAGPVVNLIQYGSSVARLLIYGSVVILLMAVVSIQTSILQGIGKVYLVTVYAFFGIIGKIITNYIFVAIPSINILGAIMGNAVSFAILLILNYITINKVLKIKIKLLSHAIKPILASVVMAIIAKLMYSNFNYIFSYVKEGYFANAIALLISIVFAIVTYFFTLVLLGGLSKEDLDVLPSRITKIVPKSILGRLK